MNNKMLKKVILEELYKVLKEQQAPQEAPANLPGDATPTAASYEQMKVVAEAQLRRELANKQKTQALNTRMLHDVAGIVGTAGVAVALHSAKDKLVQFFIRYGANATAASRVFDIIEEQGVHKAGHPVINILIKLLERKPAVLLRVFQFAGALIRYAPIISIIADSITILQSIGEMTDVYQFEMGTRQNNLAAGPERQQAMQTARASAEQRKEAAELIMGLDKQIQQYGWNYVNGITLDKKKLANAFGVMNQFAKNYWSFYPAVYDLISGFQSPEGTRQSIQYDAARRRR